MKRFSAHYIYCNPQQIIKKGVVELDAKGEVVSLFSLNDSPSEIHSTEFYNGIIFPKLISEKDLKGKIGQNIFDVLNEEYKLKNANIALGELSQLYLLEGLDLINSKITAGTSLTQLL